MAVNKRIVGVGTPTGEEIFRSQPGTNARGPGSTQIENPQLERQYERKRLSTLTFDMEVSRVDARFNRAGTLIYYNAAVDAAGVVLVDRPIRIRFDWLSEDQIIMLPGMVVSGIPYDTLYVSNDAFDAGDISQLIITTDKPADRLDFE